MRLPVAQRLQPEVPVFPWRPFVIAALVFTLSVGALTGAIDLWHLRVALEPVPMDHHRAHGLAQLFGFLWLFTMGVSLHLTPRFFGGAPASVPRRRVLAWAGIGGVALLVVGRLGSLVPGSPALSVAGAALVVLAMSAWVGFLLGLWRGAPGPRESLHRFVLAGAAWWWVAAAVVLAWALGDALGGPLARVPLAAAWPPALLGGTGSWLWGIFFRAGVCTLHVERPVEATQRRLFLAWQVASVLAALVPWFDAPGLQVAQQLAVAGAVFLVWRTVRPFSGNGVGAEPTLAPRAVQAGLVFMAVYAGLSLWGAAAELGAWAPPLLPDATRHAYALGGATLLVLGFAGRMVPGFSGTTLRWPRGYDTGLLVVALASALRLLELAGAHRASLALAGASGGLAFVGLGLVSASLLGSLRWKVVAGPVRAGAGLGVQVSAR